jgi:hypothetical protein
MRRPVNHASNGTHSLYYFTEIRKEEIYFGFRTSAVTVITSYMHQDKKYSVATSDADFRVEPSCNTVACT